MVPPSPMTVGPLFALIEGGEGAVHLKAIGWAVLILSWLFIQYSPVLWKRLEIAALRRRAVRAGVIVLTFDDGPGPAVTEQLFELLAEFDARATFYVTGERVTDFRDVGLRALELGHELASHGDAHLHAWKVTPWAHVRDFSAGARAVADLGSTSVGYRPPYGKLVLTTLLGVALQRHRVDWWTDDSGDSFKTLPERSPALAALERGGGVVLLHDLDRSEPRNRFVLETTRALLEGARDRGLGVIPLGEL